MALPKDSEEMLALEKFQEKVSDLKFDNGTMMRFLRAKNLDLDGAEAMLKTHMDWKLNNIYEQALKQGWSPPMDLMLKFGGYHCGYDFEGRPVFYVQFDAWPPSHPIFEKFSTFEVMLFAYKAFIMLYDQITSKTKHQQIIGILDNRDIGFRTIFHEVQHWKGIQALMDTIQLLENNFPETLGKAYLINTARSFLWGFNLVKPFISKHTLDKVSIFGTDEGKWKANLHENLPLDAIPEQFGGTARLNHVFDILYDGVISKINNNNNN